MQSCVDHLNKNLDKVEKQLKKAAKAKKTVELPDDYGKKPRQDTACLDQSGTTLGISDEELKFLSSKQDGGSQE